MFNFSSNGGLRYNGVSEMSDVRCAAVFNNTERLCNNISEGKLRAYIKTEDKNKLFGCDTSDSPVDDVYAFTEADSTPGFAVKRESHYIKKTESLSGRRPVERKTNGLSHSNGHSDLLRPIKLERISPPPPSVKPNKQITDPFLALACSADALKKEPLFDEDASACSFTKSSISSYSVSPTRHRPAAAKKLVDKNAPNGSPKTSYKKINPEFIPAPATSKPIVNSSKNRKGRGPIVHEALQRIPPLSFGCLPRNTKQKWHAPGLEGLDCGPLDPDSSFHFRSDSDPIDFTYPFMCYDPIECTARESSVSRPELLSCKVREIRRRLAQMEYCNADLQMPKGANQLLLSVKNQLQKHKSNGYRLNESTMNMLYSLRGCHKTTKRKARRKDDKVMNMVECSMSGCRSSAMVCSRFCLAHITASPEQLLFIQCTAKFSDNTQCRTPVLNIYNHLPLCDVHTWKRDNYCKLNQGVIKSKKPTTIATAQRTKPSTITTITSNKKQCNTIHTPSPADSHVMSSGEVSDDLSATFIHHDDTSELNVCSNSSICDDSSEDTGIGGLSDSEFIVSEHAQHIVDPEMVAEVLAMQVEDELPNLGSGPQEETNIDLNTVLNDFFATEQNSEYIPTKEETEELERALEAVNQDVKSLEKLTQHSSLLDSLLDENALAETLASLPDVFTSPHSKTTSLS